MDAERALADLIELSRDVETVAILDAEGSVVASNAQGEELERLATAVVELVREAELVKPGDDGRLTRLRAPTAMGLLVAARDGDHTIVATAPRAAPPALLAYDVETCLRALAGETADARA